MIIGTGYHYKDENSERVARLWMLNTMEWARPEKIVVTSTGKDFPSPVVEQINGTNLGHIGELLNGVRPNSLCGRSASVLLLAFTAFNMGQDLVFKEQDAF